MPPNFQQTSTAQPTGSPTLADLEAAKIEERRKACLAKGGIWDSATNTCDLDVVAEQAKKQKEEETKLQPKVTPKIKTPETFRSSETGEASGITLPDGRTFLGLTPNEIEQIALAEQEKTRQPLGTVPVGTAQRQAELQQQGQLLAGQVGQIGQLPISPTGLDIQEAATQGIIGSIPRALSLAATGAGIGLAGGAVAGGGVGSPITAPAGAAIGAVGGFLAGIASSMISNFRSQRTDTTTAQQRVLDEGKQTMKDFATFAKADPTNKAFYLAEYNKVAARIDQAYRQMKLDTSRDIAKFETALPNLAEFEAFYSVGGERDTLDIEMRNALLGVGTAEYEMLELSQRRTA